MFGISNLFNALRRLTVAVTHSAELVEAANDQLEGRLVVAPEVDEPLSLPAPEVEENGRRRARARA